MGKTMLRIQLKTSKLIVNQYLKYATASTLTWMESMPPYNWFSGPYFPFFSQVHEFMSPSGQIEVLLAFLWKSFISNTEQSKTMFLLQDPTHAEYKGRKYWDPIQKKAFSHCPTALSNV